MKNIRNIGIIAHIDAGKTTLSERMLYYSRKIHRLGEVHDGTATMDYMPEEQERGITIMSACTTCQWNEHTINLIDTPGHVDFTIEVERSLRVLDGAVGVFCGVAGVEPQSETVWRQSESFGVPKIAFINKMDRMGADFANVLEGMKKRLGANPLPLTIPNGEGEAFDGVLDLLAREHLDFDQADQGRTVTRRPWSDAEAAVAEPWRESLLEHLAEADEPFLDLYLGGEYSLDDVRAALRRATLSRAVTPVLCGSALHNSGVQPVLDAVCDLLPSPLDVPAPVGRDSEGNEVPVPPDAAAPAVVLIFKVLMENGRKLAFARVYAGSLHEGDALTNTAARTEDRISRIYRMHADRREQLESASTGEIVTLVGLRGAHTGETYCHNALAGPMPGRVCKVSASAVFRSTSRVGVLSAAASVCGSAGIYATGVPGCQIGAIKNNAPHTMPASTASVAKNSSTFRLGCCFCIHFPPRYCNFIYYSILYR